MMSRTLGFATVVLVAFSASASQPSRRSTMVARLNVIAESYEKSGAFMGTVLVAHADDTLLEAGYGVADTEWNIPNAPDAEFRLGSLTKQFTAALVLLLQEDGKLRIEKPVTEYLPSAPTTWSKIRVADLLQHTSGIPDFTQNKDFSSWSMSRHSVAEEIAYFRNLPLDFVPGTQYAYSNSNYEVLGAILENLSGKTYSQLLQERLFVPLGMRNTGLDSDELILPKRAQGYSGTAGHLLHARSESMTVPWAAGSTYSTVSDLLVWERGLFSGRVLSSASLRQMTTAGKGHYGLGVEVFDHHGIKVIEHNGGIEGFSTFMAYVPAQQITVIVLGNIGNSAPHAMGGQLLDAVLGRPVIIASERRSLPISPQEVQRFVGVFRFTEDFDVTMTKTAGDLTMVIAGQSPVRLLYQGVVDEQSVFYDPRDDAEVRFTADPTGSVIAVSFVQGDDSMTAKRR